MAVEAKNAVGANVRRGAMVGMSCLGMVAILAGCAAPASRSQPVVPSQPSQAGVDPCDQPHKDFIAAAAAYSQQPSRDSSAIATSSIPHAGISGLRIDAQAADDALAGLVGTFGTLAACRSDVLAATEIQAAHRALAVAGATEKDLAARLAEQRGGRVSPVPVEGAAAAAMLASEQPYLATDPGQIYDRPDARARPIASLRKGQRLTSPATKTAAKPGWLAIDLNDGSTGYVSVDLVRPLGGRSPIGVASNASTTVVAIDLITEALPEKLAALQARLAASEETTSGGS